jgi:hypothetical protein
VTRSPLFYPLNRGMDAEAGGVADLQTDVMRFIAILALCLVAIFALVQSIPLLPAHVEPPTVQTQAPQVESTPIAEPATPEPTPNSATDPEPQLIAQPSMPKVVEDKPLVITRPAAKRYHRKPAAPKIIEATVAPRAIETVAARDQTVEVLAPASEPIPAPQTAAASESRGFTLRFETDVALTRLVARNEVGLYAITPDKSVRMNVNRGALSFWAASVPNQFHEMDEATVPDEVLSALRRAGSVKTSEVKWGVTLPSNMRAQLNEFLNDHQGGSLIISGDGNLRLEP